MPYYRTHNESHDGEVGHFYCEVIDQYVTRMINAFGDRLYWATAASCKDARYDFTDQPEFPDADIPELTANFNLIELSRDEFENIWSASMQDSYLTQYRSWLTPLLGRPLDPNDGSTALPSTALPAALADYYALAGKVAGSGTKMGESSIFKPEAARRSDDLKGE